MSGAAPSGGANLPNLDPNPNLFRRTLFIPTRAIYPPLPGQPDPDNLIRDIPFPEKAFSDFQSVPFAHAPRRDVPSILIAHLQNPQTCNPEPEWTLLMNHFLTARCLDGLGNCQDLYIFLTRLVIPNAIIENRRLLHELYMQKQHLSPNIKFRYDYWHIHDNTYIPPTAEPIYAFLSRPVRPVLRSVPTPNGQDFVRWLRLPLNTPLNKRPCPEQLVHRHSPLDEYLNEDEGMVRRIQHEALIHRTAKVLSLFWWISAQNAWLRVYERGNWIEIEACIVV